MPAQIYTEPLEETKSKGLGQDTMERDPPQQSNGPRKSGADGNKDKERAGRDKKQEHRIGEKLEGKNKVGCPSLPPFPSLHEDANMGCHLHGTHKFLTFAI